MHVWYADGPDAPLSDPFTALASAGLTAERCRVTLGWMVEPLGWLDDPRLEVSTVLAGYALAGPVNRGTVTAIDARLSAVPSLIAEARPDVAVVSGVRRGDALAFSRSVGWGDVLARSAGAVVVEVDEHGVDLGGPEIEGIIVATIERPARPPGASSATSRRADEIDRAIGAQVAALLPDGATLQFGPGGIGEGIAASLERPVAIWSGLVTEAMAELADRGLLLRPVVAAYAWGGEAIARLAAEAMLELVSSTRTHDISLVSSIPRFVGCNTALQIDVQGAVNVSRVGGRTIAAVGGHADYCAGASRSVGGLSVIALRSTTARGISTVVPRVEVVSTSGIDVDVVVTEHGVADLRGLGQRDRAARIAAIAAPDHRAGLLSF